MKSRLVPIDVLRGIVMMIMTVDHASETFNGGRYVKDSVWLWKPGTDIPAAQFLTRWITHLCAPTFVLLAGAALAISTEKRRARGESERTISMHIASRGLLIVVFEIAWMSPVMMEGFGRVLLQVLYAIGASLVCMAWLRRLSDRALLGIGIGITALSELGIGLLMKAGLARSIPFALLLCGGFFGDRQLIIAYPLLPWLAIMCIGWALGRRLLAWGDDAPRIAPRVLARWGLASLAVFAIVRGIDGYGNMLVHRDSLDALQWLHVSKYPPALTYVTLELGLAALVLAALFRFVRADVGGPVVLFGQVALFYYLLHIHLMQLVAWAAGILHHYGVASAWIGALVTLVALYPACRWYRGYKAGHTNLLTRYV
ncbi:MAG TPA: heparan-alpha-glucosaminide N-acetyltransferase domain-containing protein [Labilithrix sp.]